MFSIIKDDSRPFDLLERMSGLPDGFDARIVRLAPGLRFDATLVLPSRVVPDDVDCERSCANAVVHRSFDDLASAQDWIMAWADRAA